MTSLRYSPPPRLRCIDEQDQTVAVTPDHRLLEGNRRRTFRTLQLEVDLLILQACDLEKPHGQARPFTRLASYRLEVGFLPFGNGPEAVHFEA